MKVMSIYMRDETAAAVKRTAAAQGRSISNFITHNIKHALGEAEARDAEHGKPAREQTDWIEEQPKAKAEHKEAPRATRTRQKRTHKHK